MLRPAPGGMVRSVDEHQRRQVFSALGANFTFCFHATTSERKGDKGGIETRYAGRSDKCEHQWAMVDV